MVKSTSFIRAREFRLEIDSNVENIYICVCVYITLGDVTYHMSFDRR